MLAPFDCPAINGDVDDNVYNRYRSIRGKSTLSEGVGLPKERLLEIPANHPGHPCNTFGIHEELPALKALYDSGNLNFVANAGLLAKPVNTTNYK